MSCSPENRDHIEALAFDLISKDAAEIREATNEVLSHVEQEWQCREGLQANSASGAEDALLHIASVPKPKPTISVELHRAMVTNLYSDAALKDAAAAMLLAQAGKIDEERKALALQNALSGDLGNTLEKLRRKYGRVAIQIVDGRPVFMIGEDLADIGDPVVQQPAEVDAI